MSEKLVTIATFDQVIEAHFSRTKLQSEGIESFILDEYSAALVGFPTSIGGIRLQVKESDAKIAIEILHKNDLENRI